MFLDHQQLLIATSIFKSIATSIFKSIYLLLVFVFLFACDDDKPLMLELSVGDDQIIALGQSLQISAKLSEEAQIEWKIIQRPTGSISPIEALPLLTEKRGQFYPDVLGTYTILAFAHVGERSKSASISVDVICAPPIWQIELTAPQGLNGKIGQRTDLFAQIDAAAQTGCENIPALAPSIHWRLISKPPTSDASLISISQKVQGINIDELGQYLIQASVTDSLNREQSAQVRIQADCGHHAPTLTLSGPQQANMQSQPISIQAIVSDIDEDCGLDEQIQISWTWLEKPSGSLSELQQTDGLSPWLIADRVGRYRIQATATDPQGLSSSAIWTIEVNPCGQNPPDIQNIRFDQNEAFIIGKPIAFDLIYQDLDQQAPCDLIGSHQAFWDIQSAPFSSQAQISPHQSFQPTFIPDLAGLYVFQVKLIDEANHQTTQQVSIQVEDCGQSRPTIEFSASPQQMDIGQSTTLSVRTHDLDDVCGIAQTFRYEWQMISMPALAQGLNLTENPTDLSSISFTPTEVGNYIIGVRAIDQSGNRSDLKTLTLEVSNCGRLMPVLTAFDLVQSNRSMETNIQEGDIPVLSARLDEVLNVYPQWIDPNEACGRAVNEWAFHWQLLSKPLNSEAEILNANLPFLSIALDQIGRYAFELSIRDQAQEHSAAIDQQSVFKQVFEIDTSTCGAAFPMIEWQGEDLQSPLFIGEMVAFSVLISDLDTLDDCAMFQDFELSWSMIAQPVGSQSSLSENGRSQNWFIPDVAGFYTIQLSVWDQQGHLTTSQKEIEVLDCRFPPPENIEILVNGIGNHLDDWIGNPAWIVGRALTLSSTWSELLMPADQRCLAMMRQPEEMLLNWRIVDRPVGSFTILNDRASRQPWLIADQPGHYVVEATLEYAKAQEIKVQKTIEISTCGSRSPVVHIESPSLTINQNQMISLKAVANDGNPDLGCELETYANLDLFTYHWSIIESPANANINHITSALSDELSLSDFKQAVFPFQANVPGRYRMGVVVEDDQNRSSLPAVIDIDVLACGGLAPSLDSIDLIGARLPNTALKLAIAAQDPNALCDQPAPLSYHWRVLNQPIDSSFEFSNQLATQAQPHFILTTPGVYQFELEVSNTLGLSVRKSISFEINVCGTSKPVADLQISDSSPQVGQSISLSATNSFDPDASIPCSIYSDLTYHWQLQKVPAGYEMGMQANQLFGTSPWFFVPIAGVYEIMLSVSDQTGKMSDPKFLSFEAQGCGHQAPIIEEILVSTDSPQVGDPFTLQAIVLDADIECGGVVEADVRWTLIDAPAQANVDLSPKSDGKSVALTTDVEGVYVLEALAISRDGKQSIVAKSISVEVNDCGSFTPTISLEVQLSNGQQQKAVVSDEIIIQAQTKDADELGACGLTQSRSIQWQILSKPAQSNVVGLTNAPAYEIPGEKASQSAVTLIADQAGTYQVEAVITDQTGRSSAKTLMIEVEGCVDPTPSIQTVTVSSGPYLIGQAIQLFGEIADLPIGCVAQPFPQAQASTWVWQLLSRPNQSLSTLPANQNQASQTLVPDLPGRYTIAATLISASGKVSAPKIIDLNVVDCGDQKPIIDSITSTPQSLNGLSIGQPIELTVNAHDPDDDCGQGQPIMPIWRLTALPIGSQASLSNPQSSKNLQFSPDVAGIYEISVQVVQDMGNQSSDLQKVRIQVGDCGGQNPQALIKFSAPKTSTSSNQINGQFLACSGASFVQLDAIDSSDPNTACGGLGLLRYQWQVVEVSAGISARLVGQNAQTLNLAVQGISPNQNARIQVKLTVQNEFNLQDEAYANIDILGLDIPHTVNINPNLFCGQAQQVQFSGSNYYRYQNQLPSVQIGDLEVQANQLSNCINLIPGELDRCSNLTVNLPGGLSAELYQAKVRNPYPLACHDQQAPSVFVLSAPQIDQIMPRPICRGQFDGNLTLFGSGLIKVPALSQATQITVNNISALQTQITDCENVSNFELCRQASFGLPLSQKDVANLNVKLSNPNPGACLPQDLEVTYLLKQSEPPLITEIVPKKICDQGGSLDLIGDHFEAGMTVALGPYLADSVQNTNGAQRVRASWQVQNAPRFIPNLYQVTARNATGCATTSPILVRVTEGPVPFFVDPPIVYNGITLQATAYLGNLFGGSVTKVEISKGQANPINLDFSFDPSRPSQIKLIIPSGLEAGTYDLTLFDDVNCPGTTTGLLKITNQLGLSIASVDPPFAWNQGITPVTATAGGNTQFIPTPRSYLTPSVSNQCTLDQQCGVSKVCRQGRCTNTCISTNDCTTGFACSANACVPQASELKASSLKNVTTLQGIVGSGFATGYYDLVVVNPNGQVGLLTKAIKVNSDPPPQIEGVSPGSWKINEPALPVQISGTGFNQATVKATCVFNGQSTQYPLNIISQNANLIDVRIDTSLLSANTVCSIRVLNLDASYDDFSPMTTVNPSGNFVSFSAESNLPINASRRLSTVIAANIPNSTLSLFMIAGDQGSVNTALDDVYTTQIDGFGRLGTWEKLDNRLPMALTYSQGVNVGRFIYMIGGMQSNGQSSAQVLRAEILDPLYVPQIQEVDFEFDQTIDGLSTGVYYYRVTAIYGANDQNNPSGESLASEPQPVFIPNLSIGVRLSLAWTGLTDDVGYRIYRSPTPNLLLGQEQLIAELSANTFSFKDDGIQPISLQKPLKQGALGHWKQVATLNGARSQHAVVVATDPVQAKLMHVYAFAGLQNGLSSRSYEHFSVDISNDRQHVLSTVSLFNASLSVARTKLNALVATPQEASFLSLGSQPKKSVIYVLGGDNTRTVEVAQVLANGALSPWGSTADMSRSRIGYAAGIANNTLLTVCGQNGSASTSAEKGEICGLNCSPAVEDVSRWSALGNTGALRSCVDPGFASAKGFFYLIGGGDGNQLISNKIDVSLLGGTP